MSNVGFERFDKLKRLNAGLLVTEKIDGTNAQIHILDSGEMLVGSRSRYITPDDDNFGFAAWAYDNEKVLVDTLGTGRHYGEWWGLGIQRCYNMDKKVFSLFNCGRWKTDELPLDELRTVPFIAYIPFSDTKIEETMANLKLNGSLANPGFQNPEGIVLYHKQSGSIFKETFDYNESGKNKPRDEHENVIEGGV